MIEELSNKNLESVVSYLTGNGWFFEQDNSGLYYGFDHNRKVITFKYTNMYELVDAIMFDIIDDPGAYEVHFNLPYS